MSKKIKIRGSELFENLFANIVSGFSSFQQQPPLLDFPKSELITDEFDKYNEHTEHTDTDIISEDPIEVTLTKVISAEFICLSSDVYFKNKKDIMRFNCGDGVILPPSCGERLFKSSMKMYTISISSKKMHDVKTYGKVVNFDAPDRCIIMPQWMMSAIYARIGDRIDIDTVSVGKISKICFSVPKCLTDAKSIIEFYLKDHSISYIGKQIKINMFEKTYIITVTNQSPLYVGTISNQDIDLEVVDFA